MEQYSYQTNKTMQTYNNATGQVLLDEITWHRKLEIAQKFFYDPFKWEIEHD
jgi:hypothetical protein